MLASGSGTNLQALLDAYPENLVVVAGDKKEAFAFERARRAGVFLSSTSTLPASSAKKTTTGSLLPESKLTASGWWWGPGTCGYCRRASSSASLLC